FDSAHARPVAGATVMLSSRSSATDLHIAHTDEKGRFRLDTLEAGSYLIQFTTPFLDSLEHMLPPQSVILGAGERRRVQLAVPSGATLRAGACPGLAIARGTGAIVGRAEDADTDSPLIGAQLVVSWRNLTVDRVTLQPSMEERTGAAVTDSLGQFRLCGVPTDTYMRVQLQHQGRAGSTMRVSVPDDAGVVVRRISLSAGASRSIAALDSVVSATDTSPPALLSGTATLRGTVRSSAGQPLAAAQVRIIDAAGTALTDATGQFSLSNQPAGTQMLEVRRIGFLLSSTPVELRTGRTKEESVTLTSIVSLDSIRVTARRARYREFERNRRQGGPGRFMSEEEIENRNPQEISDLVRMLPGFRLSGTGVNAQVVSTRGRISFRSAECVTNIVIDGMQRQEINLLRPSDLGAMEYYRGPSDAPPQYESACGVIVLWTKR
ncbi:MAG: TonB-dependent receptor, partial [Gemmatimonadaceae bacterium]|nr:TonB-dependent receptor [Gemmatimonadaceae bacterium]